MSVTAGARDQAIGAEPVPARADAGMQMARWSAKAWLIVAGVVLVGGAVWYARSATVPLIVAALITTQVLPLVDWAAGHGIPRGIAIAASMLGVVMIGVGLAWLFADALFGNLGGVGDDLSKGADEAINWLQANSDWVAQHQEQVRSFLQSILPAAKSAADGVI